MGVDRKVNTQGAAHSRLVICVFLRMATSAEAPWSPMLLLKRLRARGGVGMVREQACQWALTVHESEHSRAEAHPRWVIFVSLRMAASAEAPSAPIQLPSRLRARGGVRMW